MKKIITTSVLLLLFISAFSQKKYIKKLKLAKIRYEFYRDSKFNDVFHRVGKYKKNRIYIKKNCCGTFLLIQNKSIQQLSTYYIVPVVRELKLSSVKEIKEFICNLEK